MARSVIVAAVRTPFGRLGGGLRDYEAPELGAVAIRAALERVDVAAGEVEYVIMGQVLQGGAGQAPARQAAVGAGLPKECPADTINKVCASSIRAAEIADQMIRAGDHRVIVAGGMESMTNAPYALKKARFGYRIGDGVLIDLMTYDGLISTFDALNSVRMLGTDEEKVNVNGGAVALGHPIAASGARILGTMIYELRRNGGGLGLAAICSGGGQGDAILIEV